MMVDYRDIDRLVDQTLTERPMPSRVDELDKSSRHALETAAARARLTPDAFLTLSRARAGLPHHERHSLALADQRNLGAGLAIDGTAPIDGTTPASDPASEVDVDSLVPGHGGSTAEPFDADRIVAEMNR